MNEKWISLTENLRMNWRLVEVQAVLKFRISKTISLDVSERLDPIGDINYQDLLKFFEDMPIR